jgi:hypothetical protein
MMNHDPTDDDGSFSLSVFSKSNLLKEEVETYDLDEVGLAAAVGGIASLLIGFSCLTASYVIFDMFKKSFWQEESN